MYSDMITGYDGSPASRDALALGRRLAGATGAHMVVVHVYSYAPLTAAVPTEGKVELSLRGAAERVLDGAREELADVPDVSFRAVPEISTARALHAAAEEADAGLIVLGSTHRGVVGSILLGTTADQTLHAAPCAVAVAPVGYAENARGIAVVGAALDGSHDTERVARVAARVARGLGATLRLITVIPAEQDTRPRTPGAIGQATLANVLRERATMTLERGAAAATAAFGLALERRPREGDPAEELLLDSGDLDLLVVGSRGFGPLRRVILGSVSSKVVRHAACPVLAVPRDTAEGLEEIVSPPAGAAVAL